MEPKISIAQFLFTKDWKVLSDSLSTTPALSAHRFDAAPDLMKFCAGEECSLIMVNVASKEDLIQLATFMKSAKRQLNGKIMKIVAVNVTANKQFEKAIGKLGAIEIIEPNLNVKALRFKMDFWMKAMKGQAKKLGAFERKSLDTNNSEGQSSDSKAPVMVPALDCVNDIWILSKESDCKKIIGRWIVKLMGPSPYVASWTEVPNKKNVWAFQIKKSFIEHFLQGEGTWLFKGEQKPEFNWQENRWMITGDDYELFFYDGAVHSRLKLSNKVLSLAGNSMYAKTKEPHIVETFNKEFVFKNDAERITDPSLEFENEGDLGGHLEGKVKEKEQAKKDLEGKLKDQQEEKSAKSKLKDAKEQSKGNLEGQIKDKEEAKKGHLEGKVKDKEEAKKGHLEGDVKEQEASSGNLEGKIKDKEEASRGHTQGKLKEKEEEIEGHLEGKTKEREEAKRGHTHGKLKEKEEAIEGHLENKRKDKDASGDNLDGIVKELEEGKGPLKGKTKEEAISLKKLGEEKKHAQNNDKLKKDWKGKIHDEEGEEADSEDGHKQHNEKISKRWGGQVTDYEASEKQNKEDDENKLRPKKDLTDHLEKNWGGKGGSEALNTRGKSGPGVGEVKEGSLLDLKKTEKEHQKFYRNHNEATQYEADGTRKNQHAQDDIDGSMGGKTGTDHLASHYGRGQTSEYRPGSGKGPLDGSNETDKMSTHLGRKNIDRSSDENEQEDRKSKSPLAGKGKTDKFKGHYGSGKRPLNVSSENEGEADFDLDSGDDFSSVIDELEGVLEETTSGNASLDFELDSSSEGEKENVLPFVAKQEEEKDLEKLTENATVITHIVQGPHRFECKLDDYFDNTVILLCQKEGLQNSEAAVLDISMSYQGKEAQIKSKGVVMSLDDDGNGGFFITLEVPQADGAKYDFMMDMLKARQESIDGFLKKVKGL